MRAGYAFLAALSLSLIQRAEANTFYLKDQWRGKDFYQGWNWETINDPTHGRVNYVGLEEAQSKNLTNPVGNKFIMRADSWSTVSPTARGRDSVRISSQTVYDEAIFVLDVAHMPAGCATWPAYRTKSQAGPSSLGSIIDIIEGVNLDLQNQATLHTLPGCTMPPNGPDRLQKGTTVSDNCGASVNNNQGCGVLFSYSGSSYGAAFNLDGGGYYVMSRSRDYGIQVWFWSRNCPDVPLEIARGGLFEREPLLPNPTWGEPTADFPLDPDSCKYGQYFDAHQIIFDLTFCGGWAGNAWAASGCGIDTCENFVNNNDTAFREAYWEINSLRVYTPDRSQEPRVAASLL